MNPLRLALPVVVLVAGCTSASGSAPAGPSAAPPAAPTGFRVALEDSESPATGGTVSWRSTWRLTWEPVPGATSYDVHYGTNEGAGDAEPEAERTEPSLTVEAAAGTSPRARLAQDRRAGLLFTSSQLLVQVNARNAAGAGPRSLWFPVGDVPRGGVPLGSPELGAHTDE